MPRTNNRDVAGDRTDVDSTTAEAVSYDPADVTKWDANEDPGNVNDALDQLVGRFGALNEPTGFPNRTDSALSFVAGTRTLTISPTGTSFDYYIVGVKHTVSAADDIIIADTSGTHAIYYDGTVLSEVINPDADAFDVLIVTHVLVGLVYWNATDGAGYLLGDERHGCSMSGRTHAWLHNAIGAVWNAGLSISGYVEDEEDNDASLTFRVTDGEFYDEDIGHEIVDGNPANQYEQQLNGAANAEIPVIYKDDVDGSWTQDAAGTLPYKTGGTGRLAYNKDDGDGTFSQVEVADGKWVSATLIATSDWQYPLKMVQGQTEYVDKKTAVEEATAEILSWGNMLAPEVVVLFRFVLQTKDTFGSTPKCKIEADGVTDFRRSGLGGAVAAAFDHGALNGLGDVADHAYALLHDGTRPLTGSLDVGGQSIISIANGDIPITPNGTGEIILDGQKWPQDGQGANTDWLLFTVAGDAYWANFSELNAPAGGVDGAADWLCIYDVSGTVHAKVQVDDLLAVAHTHDLQTLQLDGINSNGGAFAFTTTGDVTFTQSLQIALDKKVMFGDPAVHIFSDDDGDMDQVADNDITITAGNDIVLAATGDILPSTILMTTDTEIRFRGPNQAIFSDNVSELTIGAGLRTVFNITGGEEMRVEDDKLIFNNGVTDTSLRWGANGRLDIYIGGVQEVMFSANVLNFNNGVTDTGFGWGTNGRLNHLIGGNTEMYLKRDELTFDNGLTTTGLGWATNGRLGFYVGAVEEMWLQAGVLRMAADGIVYTGQLVTSSVVAAGFAGTFRFGDEVLAPNAGAPVLPLIPAGAAGVAHGWHVVFDGVTKCIVPLWTF